LIELQGDLTQNQLNHYKETLIYLITFASNVNPIALSLFRDQIALLEVTFEYTLWCQLYKNIDESQITYYTDEETKEK